MNPPFFAKTPADDLAFAKTFTHSAVDLRQMFPGSQILEFAVMPGPLVRECAALPRARPECQHATPFQPGDLIGFSGDALSSAAICLVTYGVPRWSLSHMAIVGSYNAELVLFESTTGCELPCVIQGKVVDGVQCHRIQERIDNYEGKAWHYPLTRELYAHENSRLTRFLLEQIGKSYDQLGAFRAGGLGFSFVESLLHDEALHSFFCSELVAAAHDRIGLFLTGNAGRWSPNLLVRAERCRGLLRRPHRLK